MSSENEIKTAWDAAAAFRRGELVTTVTLGGLGPGYEQAIHLAVFAAIEAIDPEAVNGVEDAELEKIVRAAAGKAAMTYRLSGAQFGAVVWMVSYTIEHGWSGMLVNFLGNKGLDRTIMVSNRWPGSQHAQEQLAAAQAEVERLRTLGVANMDWRFVAAILRGDTPAGGDGARIIADGIERTMLAATEGGA